MKKLIYESSFYSLMDKIAEMHSDQEVVCVQIAKIATLIYEYLCSVKDIEQEGTYSIKTNNFGEISFNFYKGKISITLPKQFQTYSFDIFEDYKENLEQIANFSKKYPLRVYAIYGSFMVICEDFVPF